MPDSTRSALDDRLRVRARRRLGNFDFECDLEVPVMGITALFGPSGAGKSTLINLIAGLLRPDEGLIAVGPRVFYDSVAGVDVPIERRELGMVFQDARLFPHLTVRRNLMFGLRRAGARANPPHVSPDAVIELLGLAALLERRPHTLSGGERQRVAIGRALLAQPRMLLMDEPLASLDVARKGEVLRYIEQLRDRFRVPIVYVSHAADEVLRLARTLVALDRGAVIGAGPIDDVLRDPAAARLFPAFEAGSLLHCVVRGHDERYGLTVLAVEDGVELRVPRMEVERGAVLRVRIPARDIALALSQPADVSTVNRLPGSVVRVDPLDATNVDVQVLVGRATPLRVRVTREATERLALVPGLPVWCLIKSVALDRATLLMADEVAVTPLYALAANDSMPELRR